MRTPRDDFEAKLLADIERLRSELNWFYSQLNRPDSAALGRSADSVDMVHELAYSHEAAIQTCLRQLRQRSDGETFEEKVFDLTALQRELSDRTALVEYFAIDGNLLIAPFQQLHYVPFHALYDGERYVIETREVSVTPGATLLQRCLEMPTPPLQRALLLGRPDEVAPRVADEVAAIAPLFPHSILLVGEDATRTKLQQYAPTVDVLHIACHGRFRSDNLFFQPCICLMAG